MNSPLVGLIVYLILLAAVAIRAWGMNKDASPTFVSREVAVIS